MEEALKRLFMKWAGAMPATITALPGSGSSREYYRLEGNGRSAIGAVNPEPRENRAFFSFTSSFLAAGCPVPEVYVRDEEHHLYLLRDLGDETLFARLTALRKGKKEIPDPVMQIYRKVVQTLPQFQVVAAPGIDYSVCFPRDVFDRRSMLWDLNYFKYYFLKLAGIPYDEEALENDFQHLTGFLGEAKNEYFLYRDFQSRNVMIVDDEPWFIDYQGGRRGALQYDIASLLYDGKADLPEEMREQLLEEYLVALESRMPVDRALFMKYYYGFVLIRILQALGAYGFRGFYENKPHFLQSIPFALANLRYLREQGRLSFGMSMLESVIDHLTAHPHWMSARKASSTLTVTIFSFSYKKGLPEDHSGNGGGFVFDCRALPNPGRYEEYQHLTGKDQPVIRFLKKERAVDEFIIHASSLADQSVSNYIERGFSNLMISFGCTGGQHRSVYCAEELAKYLKSKYQLQVVVHHREIDHQPEKN